MTFVLMTPCVMAHQHSLGYLTIAIIPSNFVCNVGTLQLS